MIRFLLVTSIALSFSVVQAQTKTGTISGQVKDKITGEGLPGATIQIVGTSMGEVSDLEGNFTISKVPEGTVTIEIRFIGYAVLQNTLTVSAQAVNRVVAELELDATSLDAIEVTAQALGQAGAINQQISASSLINVVSKDKIRELPDQNAAETVGRISGVYVQRDAGEGQKIVVRGIAPRFSNVLVNGIRLPSTDPTDRSVDLSMVAPDMLSGIEVYKSMRPDLDADAIGGAVNFQFKKASDDPEFLASAQYGYNGQAQELGQYKGSLSYSKRFLSDRLGLVATGNYQRANRSSDQLRAAYTFIDQDLFGNSLIEPGELALNQITEVRKRFGGSITTDYKFNANNSLLFNTFYGQRDSDNVRRRRRYRWDEQRQEFDIRDRLQDVSIVSSSLSGLHLLKNSWQLTWQGAFSRSLQNTPNSYEIRFRELSAFLPGTNLVNQSVDVLPSLAVNKVNQTFMNFVSIDSDRIVEDAANVQFDLKIPLSLGDKISASIKTGAKYRDNVRLRERNVLFGNYFNATSGEIKEFLDDFPTLYQRVGNGGIAISNFLTGPEAKDFLNGDYFMGPGAGETNGPSLSNTATSGLLKNMASLNYLVKDFLADVDDYEATEQIFAGYALTEMEFSGKLLLLAGLRFERTNTSYRGKYMTSGVDADDGGAFESVTIDSVGERSYNEFLPMVNARYKVNSWFDIRAAATRTMGRPNFSGLIPSRRINDSDQFIDQANPLLRQTRAWNYDLYFSFYNRSTFFSIGGFHKRLRDIDYIRVYTLLIPPNDPYTGYEIRSPDNSSAVTTITGMEIDIQSNLRFLPSPFNGIIVGLNGTLIDSKTFYPFVPDAVRSGVRPFTPSIDLNGFREGRSVLQANLIFNFSLGYERKGFTGRVSIVHQGDTFRELRTRAALDAFQDANTRFDLAVKQKISEHLKVFFNCNNFTNAAELSFIGGRQRPTAEDYFGFTADMGVQFQF